MYKGLRAIVLVLGLLLCECKVAFGQAFSMNERGWGFYVNAGYVASNADKRFAALSFGDLAISNQIPETRPNARYPDPGNGLYSVGIGGFGISSGIVYGGEVNGFMSGKKSADLIDNTITEGTAGYNYTLSCTNYGADILAKIGVVVVQTNAFVLYPTVGIGYGLFGTLLKDSRDTRYYPSYSGSGNNEYRYISNNNAVLDFALHPSLFVGKGEKNKAKGFLLGLSLGWRWQIASDSYMASFKNVTYTTDSEKLPARGLSAFYMKLNIGIGRVSK